MSDSLDRSQPPAAGPVRPFSFPRVDRSMLENGLSVLTAAHGHLPVVTAALVLGGGAAAEPADRAGLAQLVAAALDAGTRDRTADELAWALESLGVEFEADARWDGVILSVVAPREKLEAAMALFAEIVRQPAFRAEDVDRLRDEQLADILQRQKEPRALAGDMFSRFVFAPSVPYARPMVGTAETVRKLAPADLQQYYRAWYAPRGAALLMVGDIDAAAAHDLARRHFGDWAGQPPARPAFRSEGALSGTEVYIVDRPGSVQSEIRVGDVGLERTHPDYFPVQVMNSLLGGAFTSRLNMNLRERNGFTYGVHSVFGMRRRPGPFVIQTAVATDVTRAAIEEILKEVNRLRDEGAPEDEVRAARDYLSGTLPLELQTTDQLAARLADLVLYDLPDDYFGRYRERILAVTPADVQRVAREHLRPERFAIVVVGDADKIQHELEALDRVVHVHHADGSTSSSVVQPLHSLDEEP
jgi:zinc protease